MGQPIDLDSENGYEITVKGEIDVSWLTGFGESEKAQGVGLGRTWPYDLIS